MRRKLSDETIFKGMLVRNRIRYTVEEHGRGGIAYWIPPMGNDDWYQTVAVFRRDGSLAHFNTVEP
tara:strand:+ start:311 stop:508 length:198 start_codon:yes stop_codon:yes gene_type:complete